MTYPWARGDRLTAADLNTAVAASLPKAGGTMTGALLVDPGTEAAPGAAFSGNADTGIYRAADGAIGFSVNSKTGLQVSPVTSSVNYARIFGGATGVGVTLTADGADASVGLVLQDKGGAGVTIVSNNLPALKVSGPALATNWIGVASTVTGGTPLIYSWGDTNAALKVQARGTGGLTLGLSTNKLAFFEATPVVKPTGVAVTAAGVHAALVSLGLIAA